MKDIDALRTFNDQAAEREYRRLQARARELEEILGVPPSNLSGFIRLRARVETLERLAASRVDPDDDGAQTEPIVLWTLFFKEWPK